VHGRADVDRYEHEPAFPQHAVDVGFALPLGIHGHRAIRDDFSDLGALLSQLVREQLAADVGMREQNPLPFDVAALRQRAQNRLRPVLRRRQIDLQAIGRQPLGSRRANAAQADAPSARRSWAAAGRPGASAALALENTISRRSRAQRPRRAGP
jgi:hypothetical protein